MLVTGINKQIKKVTNKQTKSKQRNKETEDVREVEEKKKNER